MAPFLGTLLRRGGGGKWVDNFNRSLTGSLGSMSGGPAWTILTGVWNVNGTRPTTASSQATNPLAVADPGASNVDAKLTLGAGDALYFRVKDATNWWRVLYEGWQTSSCQTCCSQCCSTCWNTCSGSAYSCRFGGCGTCNQGGCSCGCTSSGTDRCQFDGNCSYSCNPYSCNCTSCNCTSCNCTYFDNYRLLTQKMISGTLTTIHTGTTFQGAANATTQARVVTVGNLITTYRSGVQMYSGSQTDHATQKRHGIGRGASTYNTSALDDFELAWN